MNHSNASKQQEILELLPWYINGTLSQEETDRVESALKNSSELRKEVSFLKQMLNQAETNQVELTEHEVNQQFDGLMAKIQKTPGKRVITGSGKSHGESWAHQIKQLLIKPWVPSFGAMALIAVIFIQLDDPGNLLTASKQADFETHSSSHSERAENLTLIVLTKSAMSREDLLQHFPEFISDISVLEVSKTEFNVLIPADVDSKALNKLLFSLTTHSDIEQVKMAAEE